MIVDTSAIIAIVRGESDADRHVYALHDATPPKVSAATVLEAHLVAGPDRRDELDYFLRRMGATVAPFDAEHLDVARLAHTTYGRGSGSKATLNFGDCFKLRLGEGHQGAAPLQG